MSIPSELTSIFPAHIRRRGEDYVRRGAVEISYADDLRIEAVVRGSELYDVVILRREDGFLEQECTCPAWDHYGNCKHTWAVLLAADARELISFDEGLGQGKRKSAKQATPAPPAWKRQLRAIRDLVPNTRWGARDAGWPEDRRLVYVVDTAMSALMQRGLAVELATQKRLPNGEWKPPKQFALSAQQWANAPDAIDRQIAQMLRGAESDTRLPGYGGVTRRYYLGDAALDTTLRLMCESGRCRLRSSGEPDPPPLEWDDSTPWEFRLALVPIGEPNEPARSYRLEGWLRRGAERMRLDEPAILLPTLLISRAADGRGAAGSYGAAAVSAADAGDLMLALRQQRVLDVPAADVPAFLRELHALPAVPPIEVPDSIGVVEERPPLRPHLRLAPVSRTPWQPEKLTAALSFDYGGMVVAADHGPATTFDDQRLRIVRRDRDAERAATRKLREVGFREEYDFTHSRQVLRLLANRLPRALPVLVEAGWIVETEAGRYRGSGELRLEIASEIDWFELRGSASFGELSATLPELLAALRRGESAVRLGDGTLGVLPDGWRDQLSGLAGVGESADSSVRFSRTQVGVLDALLAAMPAVRVDERFEHVRRELRSFETLAPADAPATFAGELRPYQREGLAWLHFLRRFSFGGCLADDMGLGKTVQVLALLEQRRADGAPPSLVVVPRSLLFNWQQEAARFTPSMRVLAYDGPGRELDPTVLGEHALVLTTYGTLRRDAPHLAEIEFDYVVLDEAQAIKNAATATAKAARVLRAQHRLAMSGTPIENRLAELWSLFEFLNPGMLGAASVFKSLGSAQVSDESRKLLARAIRPFVLRRTKEQVAPELPEKLEQTIYVELEAKERKQYDELREHYRASLLRRIEKQGIGKSKMHILEALLRLRQAACHTGLLDEARSTQPSSKFDLLIPKLSEAVAEGHKALVFSQFTSLLALLKPHLEAESLTFEYLDGHTRDRQQRVERFQSDPACGIFLISIKAGGLGLNLTAADYVFLLDPWWNPAVESQAIDRTHRIGQTRRVFASRLIARDTVEEKVLELQRSKRDLAEAIIGGDRSVIATIKREDLELLLG